MLRRFRDPLIVLVSLVLPLVFFVSNSKEARDHNIFDRGVVFVSAPIQWVVVGTLERISNTWERYVALVGVEEDNRRLRGQVAQLTAELSVRVEQAKENERLRLLLSLKDRVPSIEPIAASLVATSPSPLFRSVRIDRGEQDGVALGSAVVTQSGVVGRVAAVSDDWADVMLLIDANHSTDVLVQRTRVRARVRGEGRDSELGVKVEYLARKSDIQPGDVLVTSGFGTVFPKGLPIGRVITVETAAFGLYQQAKVEPSVDFSRLEEVLVIPPNWPESADYESTESDEPIGDVVSDDASDRIQKPAPPTIAVPAPQGALDLSPQLPHHG